MKVETVCIAIRKFTSGYLTRETSTAITLYSGRMVSFSTIALQTLFYHPFRNAKSSESTTGFTLPDIFATRKISYRF